MKVGRRIRRLREQMGLSQAALARRADVSRMHLIRVERDDISPTLNMLERLAKPLGVKVRELID